MLLMQCTCLLLKFMFCSWRNNDKFKQPLELQKLSVARWVCHYAAVNAVCRAYDSLILTVEEVAESSTYTQQI